MKVNEEKIDDFLLDRMSQADNQAFEQEIEKDKELANQVKLQREIMGGLAVVGKAQFKARLDRIKKETFKESTETTSPIVEKKGIPSWVWWGIGVLALSLAALLFWQLNSGGEDPDVIYADLFEVYDVPVVQRDTDDQQLIKELSAYYKEEAYQAFIDGFAPQKDNFQDHPELILSLGISYLVVDQPADAAKVLANLEQSNYPAYHDHARWYRILAALKMEDFDKVQELLPALLENGQADHHAEAKDLAKRL